MPSASAARCWPSRARPAPAWPRSRPTLPTTPATAPSPAPCGWATRPACCAWMTTRCWSACRRCSRRCCWSTTPTGPCSRCTWRTPRASSTRPTPATAWPTWIAAPRSRTARPTATGAHCCWTATRACACTATNNCAAASPWTHHWKPSTAHARACASRAWSAARPSTCAPANTCWSSMPASARSGRSGWRRCRPGARWWWPSNGCNRMATAASACRWGWTRKSTTWRSGCG